MFTDTNINITVEGKKHLGAIVGKDKCKVQHVKDLVNNWNTQLKFLLVIAKNQPQAAYLAFVSGQFLRSVII